MTSLFPSGCSSSSSSNDGDTAYICMCCGKVFDNLDGLQEHQKDHDAEEEQEEEELELEVPTVNAVTVCENKNDGDFDTGDEKNGVVVEMEKSFGDLGAEQETCSSSSSRSNDVPLQVHYRLSDYGKLINVNGDKNKNNNVSARKKVKKEVVKNHICSVCTQPFEKRSYLLLHMRSHTGERPYKCSICSKDFRLIGHITTHMSTHMIERPFQCTVCEKTFVRGDYMKKHMRTHSGERPFVCSICDRAFALKSNLERHMVSHTKVCTCTVCEQQFSTEKVLMRHLKNVHHGVSVDGYS